MRHFEGVDLEIGRMSDYEPDVESERKFLFVFKDFLTFTDDTVEVSQKVIRSYIDVLQRKKNLIKKVRHKYADRVFSLFQIGSVSRGGSVVMF